eukprot:jgi/Chlat1/8968/Chrsp94S08263
MSLAAAVLPIGCTGQRMQCQPHRNGNRRTQLPAQADVKQPARMSAKQDSGSNSTKPSTPPSQSLSKSKLLALAAVLVFDAGFIDAGYTYAHDLHTKSTYQQPLDPYSGDWSRIGAISPATEETLRAATFAVVPASLVVSWKFLTQRQQKA